MIRPLMASLIVAFLVGCGSQSPPATAQTTPTLPAGVSKITQLNQTSNGKQSDQTIYLSLIIYIIDDQQQVFSSQRTADEITEIQAAANQIWSQADIAFNISEIRRITVPLNMSGYVIRRQFDRFFAEFEPYTQNAHPSAQINGIYVQTLKGDNGLQPTSHNAYFIADGTLNETGRTVAHELGHILSLGHTNNDPTKLMHSGTNGIILTASEIALARSSAEKLKQ